MTARGGASELRRPAAEGCRKMATNAKSTVTTSKVVDILLPVFLLALLIALCIQLLLPFVGLLLWTIILATCFYPLHKKLMGRGWSSRRSAIVLGTLISAFILVPTAVAAISAAGAVPRVVDTMQSGKDLPPAPAALSGVPLIGERATAMWNQADNDWPAFKKSYGPQLASASRWMVKQAAGTFVAILLLVIAVILAAVTLAYEKPVREFAVRLFARITGSRASGEHYLDIVGATVRSVANGVIGVAFVQAFFCGIGFFLVGIPGAGILSILAMVVGVLQIPVVIITLPAIIFAFAVKSTTVAILFTIWFVIAGLSDAVLKPLLIGHGLEVPMPVILLGVIGGVMAYGLVGLFIGAVLLAVGYVLMRDWLDAPAAEKVTAGKSPRPTLQAAE